MRTVASYIAALAVLLFLGAAPALAQCSGQFSAGQTCGNASASQALPSASSLSALLDRNFGSAQGDVLYRGSATWGVLTPGTSGQALVTGGAGANPSWASVLTGITIGTTPVTSGSSGCVMFETSGSKVGCDSGFTYAGSSGSVTAAGGFVVGVTASITYTNSTTGSANANNCVDFVGANCIFAWARSGSGIFLGPNSGPTNLATVTFNDAFCGGLSVCQLLTSGNPILIGNSGGAWCITCSNVVGIGHVVGANASSSLTNAILIGTNESAPIGDFLTASSIIDLGSNMYSGTPGCGLGGPFDIVISWKAGVLGNEGCGGATVTGFNTVINGAGLKNLIDGGNNWCAQGANCGAAMVHGNNNIYFGNVATTGSDDSDSFQLGDPLSGTLWASYNKGGNGAWLFAGGVASRTCTINTANVTGGITVTLVGGLVTATSGC